MRIDEKICPELLKLVEIQGENKAHDCIVFSRNLRGLCGMLKAENLSFHAYPFMNAVAVKLTSPKVVELAKQNVTTYISREAKVFAQVDVARKILDVDAFHDTGIFGEGVTVCVIDTGINPHLDFCVPKNRIIKFVDLVGGGENPYDDNGHGTFVAGVLGGSGLASGGKFKGVAPRCNIISVKALEANGETGAYKILEAMQWVADNKNRYNIRVVCMSFGSNPLGKADPLVVGAEALWDMGITVVAAAGNSGPEASTIKSPGYSPRIITVGGLDDGRNENGEYNLESFSIANFSSRGPAGNFYKPDLIAPAVNISGTVFDETGKVFYQKMSGTSVATPIVAGVCALILSVNKNLTPNAVKQILLQSCGALTGNKNLEGSGLPNLKNLIKF